MKKVKKILVLVFAMCMVVGFAGCSSPEKGKPEGLSDEQYDGAKTIVKAIDMYFDDTYTALEMLKQFNTLKKAYPDLPGKETKMSKQVQKDIDNIFNAISKGKGDEGLLKARNKLAKDINMDEREK